MNTILISTPIRTVYKYRNVDGTEYCQVVRVDKIEGNKDVITKPSGLPGPHPLYRAEKLANLPRDATVFIVEGEKCVHALEDAGLVSTTSKGGSNAANKTDWTPLQHFQDIAILPDNDEAGHKYAQDVIHILQALPGARRVKVVNLPGLDAKGDVYDYLQDNSVEDLMAIIDQAPAYTPGIKAASENDWPEPKPVVSVLSVVMPLRSEMLPSSLRTWCYDSAERMQAPADYIAVSAITMLGSLIGRQLCIRPKEHDNWSVKPNVWGILVGQPSMMKSPCLKEARRFLDAIDRHNGKEFEGIAHAYDRQMLAYQMELEAAKRKARGAKTHEDRERAIDDLVDKPEEPTRTRIYTQDATVEKLQQLLIENPRGMLLLRDELIGFLRGLDKPGCEGSRAFFLEAWEGNGRFSVDRIGRGSITIDGVCCAVLGCATPGGISSYVVDALGNGEGADGLLQRFSLISYPDDIEEFRYTDRHPDTAAMDRAGEAFDRCNQVDANAMQAACYNDSLPFLRYDSEAQPYFEKWYTELAERCRSGNEHTALQAHLMKFSKLVPALSLIFHVCEGNTGQVGITPFMQAAAWAEYAESHARRLYRNALHDITYEATRELLRHIENGDLQNNFTQRDVYRPGWTHLTKDTSTEALSELMATGHIRSVLDSKSEGGRPTLRYELHPKYRKHDHEHLD